MVAYFLLVLMSIVGQLLAADASGKAAAEKKGLPASNFTVTNKAVLTFQVKNIDDEGEDLKGDLEIALFGDTTPVTVLNFLKLCEGFQSTTKYGAKKTLQFKNTHCHRLVQDMLVQCGDVTTKDGFGSQSVYGDKFNDENFIISHESAGVISMANQGRDSNGSQFFILFGRARYLDEKHVAFGKVVKGMDVLEAINEMGSMKDSSTPKHTVQITSCKSVKVDSAYNLSRKTMKDNDPNKEVPFL